MRPDELRASSAHPALYHSTLTSPLPADVTAFELASRLSCGAVVKPIAFGGLENQQQEGAM